MSDERPETYIEQAKKIMDRLEACVDEHYAACALTPLYEDADVVTKLEYMLRVLAANSRGLRPLPSCVSRLRNAPPCQPDCGHVDCELASLEADCVQWLRACSRSDAAKIVLLKDADLLRWAQLDLDALSAEPVRRAFVRAVILEK